MMTARAAGRARAAFVPRAILFHDGRALRRMSIGRGVQVAGTLAAALMIGFSGYGAAEAAYHTAKATGVIAETAPERRIAAMEQAVDAMQARVATIRHVAAVHAERLEQRQALLATALTGKGDAAKLALATLSIDPAADHIAGEAIKPFAKVEAQQAALAGTAQRALEARYAKTAATVRGLGLDPQRIAPASAPAMGGPLLAADSAEAVADIKADQQFRALFQTWKKLDGLQTGAIAIPSVHPVEKLAFTSNFGIRIDPFRGTAAMHTGVDIQIGRAHV